MRVRAALSLVPLAFALPACEPANCKPTKTKARDAAVANLDKPFESGVLSARLTTAGGTGIASETIEFHATVAGQDRLLGEGTTNTRGDASFDMKAHPLKLTTAVRGRDYSAEFGGGDGYCSSSDSAQFHFVGK